MTLPPRPSSLAPARTVRPRSNSIHIAGVQSEEGELGGRGGMERCEGGRGGRRGWGVDSSVLAFFRLCLLSFSLFVLPQCNFIPLHVNELVLSFSVQQYCLLSVVEFPTVLLLVQLYADGTGHVCGRLSANQGTAFVFSETLFL